MSDRSYGFGIVGCGVIAPFHARALAELPNARLVAVADAVAERAREMASDYDTEALGIDALLERPDIDVVCVCVPSGQHAAIGVHAAAAGKHVVTEKPIDITLESADRLIDACSRHRVALTVISQHRWDPGTRALKELVDSGRLGTLVIGDAYVKSYRTQEYYDSGSWRGTWSMDGGGALMNQGVHYVDLLQWIMGPVQSVVALTRTLAHERIEVEDIAIALLTFASGAVGVLECSTAAYPGFSERLEVSGTGGSVIVEAGELKVRELKDEKGETSAYGGRVEVTAREDSTQSPHYGHREQLREFLEAIDAGRPPAIDGEAARRPLEIILAVYESARAGREVKIRPRDRPASDPRDASARTGAPAADR